MISGVERWRMKGAPLMKLFKSSERPLSDEDQAAIQRLMAISSRIRASRLPGMEENAPAASTGTSDPLEVRDVLQ